MDFARAVPFLELSKLLLEACAAALTLSVGVFAFRRPRTRALLLIAIACFVTAFKDCIYVIGSLQTLWKVTFFPLEIRGLLYVVGYLLFMVEVFLWPIVLFLLVRERRATMASTI
jgi:hypothetical protein